MAENLDGRTLSLSDRDPNPGPLMPKLMAGRNVSIKNYGQAIKIDVDVPLTEGTRQAIENIGKVCVQQEDTPEYLRSKILQGDRITITDNDHTLTINADVQDGDHKVLASSGDTTADYLDQKLSGSGVVAVTDNTTSLSVGITPSSTDGQVLTTDNGAVAWKNPTTQTGDHKVAVNSSDSSPDYLFDKIEAGTNSSTSVSSGKVKIDAATQTGDHKVLVDSSDTNPQYLGVKLKAGAGTNISYYNHDKMEIASLGQVKVNLLGTMDYLGNKILQGSGITLTKTDNDITIAADTQTGDHKVSVDGTDTANYLENKIEAGTNVSVTKSSGKLIISSTDTGMLNPMTAKGDLIAGGVSGSPYALSMGTAGQVLTSIGSDISWSDLPGYVKVGNSDNSPDYLGNKLVQGSGISFTTTNNQITIAADTQTGDHKVLADNGDGLADYLGNKITVSGGLYKELLTVGTNTRVGLSIDTTGSTAGQVLASTGSGVSWTNLPRRIDWTVETAFINGTFNQTVDRTFYVEMFPECEFNIIDAMVAVLDSSNSGDEWRVAVFDNTRTMTYYGTSTGTSTNFRKFTSLTKLADHTFDANNVYYLAISQHTAGNANSKLKTAAVTSPAYCWYEDVALTSGRAMPATSSLTAVSGKVPAIGLRGR